MAFTDGLALPRPNNAAPETGKNAGSDRFYRQVFLMLWAKAAVARSPGACPGLLVLYSDGLLGQHHCVDGVDYTV